MEFVITFFVGLLIGGFFVYFLSRFDSVGTLRVDRSDPYDGPHLFLELSKGIDAIGRKKYVILKVNNSSYIPHE